MDSYQSAEMQEEEMSLASETLKFGATNLNDFKFALEAWNYPENNKNSKHILVKATDKGITMLCSDQSVLTKCMIRKDYFDDYTCK